MKITLRPLAIFNLAFVYARTMGENKIRHYSVSMSKSMLGADPKELIRQYILKEEPGAEIEFLEPSSPGDLTPTDLSMSLPIQLKTYLSLQSRKIPSQLYQFNDIVIYPIWKLILGKISPYINRILKPINLFIRRLQVSDAQIEEMDRFTFLDRTYFQIPYLLEAKQGDKVRCVSACTYHSVAYEEGDEEIAKKAIADDLEIYQSYEAILGHLAMPQRIELADTIGSGKKLYAIFVFLFVDNRKLPGWNPLTATKSPSPFPGIKTATYEGGLGVIPEIDYTKRYEIETISVASDSEENIKAHRDAYEESLPGVAKAVQNTRKKIEERKSKE